MSTETGDKAVVKAIVDQARPDAEVRRADREQLQFLDPISADEIFSAQEALGGSKPLVEVLREAKKGRAGRKPGSRNRRTDDFARYIRQFGQDPAITLMQIQSTSAEELVARSQLIDTVKRQMSLADAMALRARCAAELMPYLHGKKPIEIDVGLNGDFNLLIPGINISPADAQKAADGQFVLEADYEDIDGESGDVE